MTTAVEPIVVTEPGLYDMPDDVYHRDPVPGGSLSSTGARKLLPPSCPALYKHWRDQGQPPKKAFDVGHAAHKEVLGVGLDIEVVPGAAWNTNAAKAKVKEIRERGGVPLKQVEYDQVKAMAAALRAHPLAGKLLNPAAGVAEQAGFWQDPETGVWCRVKFDFLRIHATRLRVIVDYKSAASAEPGHFRRSIHNFGYFQQDAWYEDGAEALGIDVDGFLFVTQEKEPPYLVTVFQLDPEDLAAGRARNRLALETYRRCTETGYWPAYSDDVVQISRPAWANYTEETF